MGWATVKTTEFVEQLVRSRWALRQTRTEQQPLVLVVVSEHSGQHVSIDRGQDADLLLVRWQHESAPACCHFCQRLQ